MSKLTPQQMNNSQLNELVLKRLQAAYQAGIKLTVLSSKAGLTGWRVRSVACAGNGSPYKYASTFTDSECLRIIKALDDIKASI